ncbi:hypothetical protein [Streptomyces sp. NBC_01304]|uniref:hypothetical protein n=1 Tax=Streptomyces sp. NBC_01304 TaxID=2903818 RepID=UPI002E0D6D68|nr:hypothetical protein OG430_01100 [Streptomyces sp. NBC_01304]
MTSSQAETGAQITNAEVTASLGFPAGLAFVDENARVSAGEWAYWPASAVATGKNLLLHKSPGGTIKVIRYGAPANSFTGIPDLPPVPELIQQAARRG